MGLSSDGHDGGVSETNIAMERAAADEHREESLPAEWPQLAASQLALLSAGQIGGLLYAISAMMAGGWRDAPNRHAPGFPDDGSWEDTRRESQRHSAKGNLKAAGLSAAGLLRESVAPPLEVTLRRMTVDLARPLLPGSKEHGVASH